MVRDVLIKGLNDEEIMLDILGESKQDMSLEDALCYIEAKESGKRSASRLADGSSSIVAASSSYKRQDKLRMESERKMTPVPCDYCGRHGHSLNRQERI